MILYVMNWEYFHNDKIQTNFLAKRFIKATLASKDNDVYNSKNWKKKKKIEMGEKWKYIFIL